MPRANSASSRRRFAELTACLIVMAATLAFGAVYPWAYGPMLVGGGVAAAAALSQTEARSWKPLLPLALAMAGLIAGIVVQLIPLPLTLLRTVSPATDNFLRDYDLKYALTVNSGQAPWHSLSINPGATALGLAFVIVLFALTLGLASTLTNRGAARVCQRMTLFGLFLAVLGIVQYSFHTPNPYGFWRSQGTDPFGPFVNRDNYAGWMLLALGCGIGYVFFLLRSAPAGPMRGMRPSHEVTEHRGRLIVAVISIAVMLLALTLTLSRAGLGAFAATALLFGAAGLLRSTKTIAQRVILAAAGVAAVCGIVAWAGLDRLIHSFTSASWNSLGHRVGVWRDTLHIVHDFPAVGTGYNTFGTATLFYSSAGDAVGRHFVEAHNDVLQLAAEGGLLLLLPAMALMAILVARARSSFVNDDNAPSRMLRVGAMFGLVAIALQDLMHFSLLIPSNAAFAAVLAAVVLRNGGTVAGKSALPREG